MRLASHYHAYTYKADRNGNSVLRTYVISFAYDALYRSGVPMIASPQNFEKKSSVICQICICSVIPEANYSPNNAFISALNQSLESQQVLEVLARVKIKETA